MTAEDHQTAGHLARNLLCFLSEKSNESLLADWDKYASETVCERMEQAVARLLQDEPLAYVLGEWSFYGMNLYVDPNVLIPRDDSCAVASLAIERGLHFEQSPRVLDLCTGCGCIGLAIASRVKDARVTLVDLSKEALAVAKKNVTRLKLSGRVACYQANALEPAPGFLGKFDLIVSNPPYITSNEMEQLPRSVRDYEPHLALHGGDDGLLFYREIIRNFLHDVMQNKAPEKTPSYFDGDAYIQHNIGIADGLSGLGAALAALAEQGIQMIYTTVHQVLAQGNFVLAVSEGTFGGAPTSYYDLWRVENGKIAEHWDVMETIAQKETWQNQNGKF